MPVTHHRGTIEPCSHGNSRASRACSLTPDQHGPSLPTDPEMGIVLWSQSPGTLSMLADQLAGHSWRKVGSSPS